MKSIRQILAIVTASALLIAALALIIYNIRVAEVATKIDNFELFMGWFFNFIIALFFIMGGISGLVTAIKYPNGVARLYLAALMPLAIFTMILTVSRFTIALVNEKIDSGEVALLVISFIIFIGLLVTTSLKDNRQPMAKLIVGEIFVGAFLITFIIKMGGLDTFFAVMVIIATVSFMVEMIFLNSKYDIEGASAGPIKNVNQQQNMGVNNISSPSVYDELPRANSHVIDFNDIPRSSEEEKKE